MSEQIKLLVVDDDALDRQAVRRAIRSGGLQAELAEAEDSAAALAALAQGRFDCILLDYRLPRTDGLAVLRELRAAGVGTPVIVLTGQGDERLAVEIMKAGATDYLAKSALSPEMLASSVRSALRISRAERQVAQAERTLAITLRSIGDAVISTDAAGNVSFMNTLAETLTGWSAAEAAGEPLDLVLPLVRGGVQLRLAGLADQPQAGETLIDIDDGVVAQSRSGAEFAIAGSGAPIRDDQGRPNGVVVVFRDITERVRSQERLRLLAELSQLMTSSLDYQAHLASLANLMVPTLADWCAVDIVQAGGAVRRLAVASRDQAAAPAAEQTSLPAIDAGEAFGPARVIRTGRPELHVEVAWDELGFLDDARAGLVRQLGLTSFLSVPLNARNRTFGAITLGRTSRGRPYDARDLAFAEDLAHRAALAVDNAVLYGDAQDAIRIRDVFLSIAAHELKTPLTSLLGYTQLLQRRATHGAVISERELRALQVVNDQAVRLNAMIAALLDVSRLQTGQLAIDRKPVDLSALTRRVVDETQPTLSRHTLLADIDRPELVVVGDELRLEQVMQNLIQNAVKYSPNGDHVHVALSAEGQWAQLSVRDHGVGIPADSLPHVFGRFYRASNIDSSRISGMGIGLYVVKQIVDLHNGQVSVGSTLGVGSTFTVSLPMGE